MTKLQDLTQKYDKLCAKRNQLAMDFVASEQKSEIMRSEMAVLMLGDQDTASEERDLERLESRGKVVQNAIALADSEITNLKLQINQMRLELAIDQYIDLEKVGQKLLIPLVEKLNQFNLAQRQWLDVVDQMHRIQRENGVLEISATNIKYIEVKSCLTPRLGRLFEQDLKEMLYKMHKLRPDLVDELPQAKNYIELDMPPDHSDTSWFKPRPREERGIRRT